MKKKIISLQKYNIKQALLSSPVYNLNEEHVVFILYNLICAINFIHSAGIIHRDIKPSNILVEEDCTIKICDFGISRTPLNRKTPYKHNS